jgi:tetratricopeptide (TPR) repeat protein
VIASDVPSLRKLRDQLSGKDYFGRLNVVRSRAPVANLKMSYLQLAKVYHPDTVPPEAPAEARKLKEDILSLLNEAYSALNDERQRTDYVDELEAREQVGDLDVEAILAAEEDFQRATLLAKARKYSEALALLETCIARNPKEGEFYAWRGYCRFFGAQDKRALRNAVLEDLLRALELSPKCTVAWLFQGQVFKLLNETNLAKQAFQKTLEMDPTNVEAQRELRLYETRKQ